MGIVTKNLSIYVREKGINISKMSRDTKIPYAALYNSLCSKKNDRSLRDDELVLICKYLDVSPMDFIK